MIPEDPLGSSYTAKAKAVDRVFDAASGTFSTRLELPDPNYQLPADSRCKVIFPVK
jgi:hypothetical protein